MCVSEEIKNLRIRNDMSQEEFGALFGFGRTSVSEMERKKKEAPDFMVDEAVQEFNDLSLALEKMSRV